MASGSEGERGAPGPRVSVVVCAYTFERFEALGEAVAALAAQSRPADELVLVIDNEPQLLEECRRRWPWVKVIPNEQRQGLSGARNTGLGAAGGDVVAFLDDDAIPAVDWLEHLAEAYADPAVVGVGGAVIPRWAEERPGWFPPEYDWVVGCTHSGMPTTPEPVRNLVGANMSFRRSTLIGAGGFRHELGRVGTIPEGCEETDLCIRIADRWPESIILYDPGARVEHVVPPSRASWHYFRARCAAEGKSKAILAALVGSGSGLSAERSYVRRTLPLGFVRGLMAALRGDDAGLGRAAAMAAGLLITTFGFVRGHRQAARIAARREAGRGDGLSVLMVTPRGPLEQGGVERHVLEVATRLRRAGVEVSVLCAEPGARRARDESIGGVPVRVVRAWPARRDYYFAPGIWREIRRRRPDLVHVQSFHTLVAPLAMLRALTLGIPYVVTFHGGGHSSELRNRMRGLQLRLLRPLLARAARLVAVARFEIDQYGEALAVPPERFTLIPNGTDLGDLPEDGLNGNAATLASIGRLERYKGHHRVIEALPYVLEREPDARLLVVGNGPYEAELKELVSELGVAEEVEFTSVPAGDAEGMRRLLARVGIVVLMSEFETHPLVALEAAAARRRLLVADEGGLAELADQGYARAIPLDERPERVAAAIVEELDRPPPTQAPPLIGWDECAGSLHELYREIAAA